MPPEPEKKPEEKPPVNDEVTKVVEELRAAAESLKKPLEEKPVTITPTYQDRRSTIQKSLGYTDEQMAAHEEMILRAQAPVIERSGWSAIEKKSDLDTYRAEIEKELSAYPQERRTPEMMEKIYFYVKGKHLDSKPPLKPEEKKPGNVERSRVSGGPGYTGQEPGMSGGGSEERTGEEEMKLDDREKFVAAKLGISETDYAKSRNVGKEIRGLRVPDDRPVTSLADIELRRLAGRK